jgi:hypothetical protein
MDKIIQKTIDYILNLRAMGFWAARWPDLQSVTGELSPADKKLLSDVLTGAGAVIEGGAFNFENIDIEKLKAARVDVKVVATLPGGSWVKENGKLRFIPKLNYIPPDDPEELDEGTTERFWNKQARGRVRGKIDVDL